MLRGVLESTNSVIFALIALVIFVAVFGVILVMTLRSKQSDIDHAANLPLDDNIDHAAGNGDKTLDGANRP